MDAVYHKFFTQGRTGPAPLEMPALLRFELLQTLPLHDERHPYRPFHS
jgi:hypothetical protein